MNIKDNIELNFRRLNEKEYKKESVFQDGAYGWPGDWEGRALLAFCCHYRLTGKKIPCMDALVAALPSKTGEKGYFGKPFDPECVDEQQLSGNSWYDYGLFSEFNQSVAPIAADDNHNGNGDVEHSDSFGGFTMICTDDFSYGGIMTALEKQDFYASTGILFDEISVSDGTLHVRCSECTCIMAYFGGRRWVDVKNSDGVTSADFLIDPGALYIRVFCTDKRNGQKAVTKPFKVTG